MYGYSSATDYPSLAVTIDPGHASGYVELKAGQGANGSGRWGDYFSAARDPSDGSRAWVAGAYGTPGGWGTYIAALSTTPFTIANPTPAPPTGGGSGGSGADTTPPTVTALPSVGRAGDAVHLRYRLSDNSKRTRERIRIRHLAKVIATFQTRLLPIINGGVYYATWKSQPTAPAVSSFCVTAFDPAGNESQPSCATLHLAGGR